MTNKEKVQRNFSIAIAKGDFRRMKEIASSPNFDINSVGKDRHVIFDAIESRNLIATKFICRVPGYNGNQQRWHGLYPIDMAMKIFNRSVLEDVMV